MRPIFRYFRKFLVYCSSGCRNYSGKREARMLQKLIRKGQKNRKDHIPSVCSIQQYAQGALSAPESRRKNVLNKIFMDEITQIVTTGMYAEQMHHLGIHVTQTRISPNYHILFVYWIHTKDINESEVNDLLVKVAHYMRIELTSMGVMSKIPEIRFAIDKDFMNMKLVETVLNQCNLLKEEYSPDQNLLEQENVVREVELEFPEMEYNVFGLRYLIIMRNIRNAMSKCGARLGGDAAEYDSQEKEPISNFDKKKLSKILFSNKSSIRKSSRRREMNSALVESKLDS